MTPGLRLGLSVLAGMAGGLIANLIWSRPPLYLGLIVGALVGAVAFFAWERYLVGKAATGVEATRTGEGYPAHQPAGATSPPVPNATAEGQMRWGNGDPTGAAVPASGSGRTVASRRPPRPVPPGPSPDLARFVSKERLKAPVRLTQCPRCGSFTVDPMSASGVYTFACRACEYTWRWSPGEPWSRVVVDPRVRVPRYRDYPEGEEANHA